MGEKKKKRDWDRTKETRTKSENLEHVREWADLNGLEKKYMRRIPMVWWYAIRIIRRELTHKKSKVKIWNKKKKRATESRHHDRNHGRVPVGDCPQSRRATSRRLKGIPETKGQTQWTIESSDSGSTFGCDSQYRTTCDWAHPNNCLSLKSRLWFLKNSERVELHDTRFSNTTTTQQPPYCAYTTFFDLFFCMCFNFMFYRFYRRSFLDPTTLKRKCNVHYVKKST